MPVKYLVSECRTEVGNSFTFPSQTDEGPTNEMAFFPITEAEE